VGCNGYPFETTPHLDQLALQGCNFTRAYAQSSWTGASHMSLMTSLYPAVHGVNTTPFPEPLPENISTLAEIFREAGYQTGGFVAGTYLKSVFGFGRGFEVYNDSFHSQRPCTKVNEKALAWLEEIGDDKAPFFLFLHYFDPHLLYEPPHPYNTMFDPGYSGTRSSTREGIIALLKESGGKAEQADQEEMRHIIALYDGEIRYADECFGEILDFLEENGELEKTLIVATSDHGESFLDHPGQWSHGRSLYEEVVHVPLIVKLPGQLPKRAVRHEIVELMDIAPTIMEAAGLAVPDNIQGRSFLALMMPNVLPPDSGIDDHSYAELIKTKKGAQIELESITIGDWKLIRNALESTGELYDLREDPKQQHNLASENPVILNVLESRLEALSKRNESLGQRKQQKGAHTYSKEIVEELKALGYLQ
jgi:arylsulfatase A-like enzyme